MSGKPASISIILFAVIFILSACNNNPKQAKKELEKRGIKFSEESFLKCQQTADTKTVKLFLDSGIDINAKNNSGQTALMLASSFGFEDTVKLLINYKADVNAEDNLGRTALLYTSGDGNPDTSPVSPARGSCLGTRR